MKVGRVFLGLSSQRPNPIDPCGPWCQHVKGARLLVRITQETDQKTGFLHITGGTQRSPPKVHLLSGDDIHQLMALWKLMCGRQPRWFGLL